MQYKGLDCCGRESIATSSSNQIRDFLFLSVELLRETQAGSADDGFQISSLVQIRLMKRQNSITIPSRILVLVFIRTVIFLYQPRTHQ